MNYYRCYEKDGTCKVICTRCFLTLGVAHGVADLKRLEALHKCGWEPLRNNGCAIPACQRHKIWPLSASRIQPLFKTSGQRESLNALVMFAAAVLLLYVLPTAVELAASRHLNTWFAIIVPGDILGCVCLALLFKMYKTGAALYLFLTACESYLYMRNVISASLLVWLVDAIPTIVVTALILRQRRKTFAPVLA